MLTSDQLDAVRASMKTLAPRGEQLADAFFARLFKAHPPLRAMFPTDSTRRNQDLLAGLETLIRSANRLNVIENSLMDFGARNQHSGILPHHYGMARDAMLDAMHQTMGADWTSELEDAWSTMLNVCSSVVIRGAGRARARAA
jgi:hemoglobin-like flavoprotein